MYLPVGQSTEDGWFLSAPLEFLPEARYSGATSKTTPQTAWDLPLGHRAKGLAGTEGLSSSIQREDAPEPRAPQALLQKPPSHGPSNPSGVGSWIFQMSSANCWHPVHLWTVCSPIEEVAFALALWGREVTELEGRSSSRNWPPQGPRESPGPGNLMS